MQDMAAKRGAGTGSGRASLVRGLLAGTAVLALAACENGMDLDLRGGLGGFSTTEAARTATLDRPQPDDRGVISYPNYQVAVARRGDTVSSVANRIGVAAPDLASYNGLRVDDGLRQGEVLALPQRVAEPSPATGASGVGPIVAPGAVDIGSMAGAAIDRAGDQRVEVTTLPPAANQLRGPEPVRHQVVRGETAYTVARLYGVSVKSLADWNGLDSNYTIREGQFLLIPVAEQTAAVAPATTTNPPGVGTPTPVPPSSGTPLPAEKTEPVKPAATATAKAEEKPTVAPDLGKQQTAAPKTTAMDYPVKGRIIREYAKGRNDGIDIAADPGTAVRAAQGGTVAALTSNSDNVKVIVVRHENKLLTVYSNVDRIAVKEGQSVTRGQKLAEIRSGESPYVHFEVRKGLEATDPMGYLN
jgi:murein DD-endopeptidase MepM/ murein hydrolase activator NlpD